MPAKRDNTGRWRYRKWVRFPDGRRIRISGTPATNTKAAAEAEERRHIRRILEPESVVRTEAVADAPEFRTYADLYIQTRTGKPDDKASAQQILNAYVMPWFGPMALDAITQHDIDAFKLAMMKGRSPKTVNNITSIVARVIRYAVRNKVIRDPGLIYHVDTQPSDVKSVSRDDAEALVGACTDPRYLAAILLAYEGGLRIGEIRGLQWSDVNELHRELRVARAIDKRNNLGDTKGRRARTIPMTARLWVALDALPRRGPWVITKLRGADPLSYWAMRDGIVAIYEHAGVARPEAPWHCLRHSYCTSLAESGAAPHLIQDLAGHQSFATTLRYIDPSAEAKRAAVAKAFGQNMGKSARTENKKPC